VRREPGSIGTQDLELSIDRDAEVPIGLQLAWRLRARISDGTLAPGHRLPGLREVAEATGVNVNTVRAVYQRLNQEGLIDTQQGSGTFVAATPPMLSDVAKIAASAAREAQKTGVDPREVAAAIYVVPGAQAEPRGEEASGPSASVAAAALGTAGAARRAARTKRRRRLREQIAALELTLAELEAKYPGVAPPSSQARRGIGPALLETDELEGVRTEMVRRIVVVQTAIDRLSAEETGVGEKPEPAPERKRAARRQRSVRPAPAEA
jgi:DNA-binding transcriptional regulator YhcF (GntR family)